MSDQTDAAAPAADENSGATTLPAEAPADAPVAPEGSDANSSAVTDEPGVVEASGDVELKQFRVTFQPSLISVVVDDLDPVRAEKNARRALLDWAAGDATTEAV